MHNWSAEKILNDDSTSKWLRQAVRVSVDERDLIDAMNDVEVLQIVLANELRYRAKQFEKVIDKSESELTNDR